MSRRPENLGPAVDPSTRELRYTSPSAIARFNAGESGCPRKWYFRYVEGIPEPTTKNQEVGIRAHAQIEHYLGTGEDVLGPIVRAGRHLLPSPGSDLLLEVPLADFGVEADGVPVIGYMDWVNLRGVYVAPSGESMSDPPGTVEVGDNKTTSNIGYAKRGDELLLTTQMSAYGEGVRKKFPDAAYVRLSHVYFQTRGKEDALKSTALFPLATIKARWYESGHSLVRQMRGTAKLEKFEDVPMNEEACSAFGGCAYRSKCFKNPLGRLKVSLLAKVRAQMQAGNGVAAGQTPPPIPSTAVFQAPIPSPSETPIYYAEQAEQGKLYKLPSGKIGMFLCSTGGKLSFVPVDGSGVPVGVPELLNRGTVVTPTTSPAPTPPSPALTPPPPTVASPPPPTVASPPPPAVASFPSTPIPTTVASEEPTEEKKRRGRPAKTEAATGIRLFVNCVPNVEHQMLDGYVTGKAKVLAEEFKVTDIRFPPTAEHPFAYGRWRGALASIVRNEPPPSGSYVAFTQGNELTEVVVEALSAFCGPGALVRGTR